MARMSPRGPSFPGRAGSDPSGKYRKRALGVWKHRAAWLLLLSAAFITVMLLNRGRNQPSSREESQTKHIADTTVANVRKIGVQTISGQSEDSKSKLADEATVPEFDLWTSEEPNRWSGCYDQKPDWSKPPSSDEANGYLHVVLSGGLNQMRVGLCDAVVVARVLNATLVVPHFDKDSWWDDHSSLQEVFDVDHLIDTLKDDVRIVKAVPAALASAKVTSKLYPRKSTPQFYIEHALPLLRSKGQLELRKFDFRLADRIDDDLQKKDEKCVSSDRPTLPRGVHRDPETKFGSPHSPSACPAKMLRLSASVGPIIFLGELMHHRECMANNLLFMTATSSCGNNRWLTMAIFQTQLQRGKLSNRDPQFTELQPAFKK